VNAFDGAARARHLVEVEEWARWRQPATRTRAAKATPRPRSGDPRIAPVPRRGRLGHNSGRAARLPQPSVWRATTASAAGIYPWLVAEPMPPVGAPIGYDVFSRSTFSSHPVEWVDRGIVTNPNLYITGVPGSGKSALIKQHVVRLAAFGTRSLILGDITGEYNRIAEWLGVTPIILGPGSGHRLNPLDGGPLAKNLPEDEVERRERLSEVHRRRLMLLKTLMSYRLGRDLRPTEEAAVGLALRRATGEDRRGRLPDPLVAAVLGRLWDLDEDDARDLHMRSRAALMVEVREAGTALRNLLEDTLAGLFDGPTSAPIDFDHPIQTVDVSRLEGRGDEALALVLSCLSSWGQAAIDDPGRGPGQPPMLVVRDELWRSMRYRALVRKLDADLRLSRAQGTIQIMATHRLADAEAAAEATVARHLVASCAVQVMMAQDVSELHSLGDDINLTEAEREMIGSWNAAHIGRGLWHVGQGRAYVVQGVLSRPERDLFFTNERMAV
jgi:type IV secretory pathway VirB4 component